MTWRQYVYASLINLVFLGIGVAIGLKYHSAAVYAATAVPAAAAESEEITPIMTVGSAGIGTLLANRVAADQVMVNGYDVLKLDEGILQLIQRKTLTPNSEVQSVVDSAKVARPLRARVSPASNSQPPAQGPSK